MVVATDVDAATRLLPCMGVALWGVDTYRGPFHCRSVYGRRMWHTFIDSGK